MGNGFSQQQTLPFYHNSIMQINQTHCGFQCYQNNSGEIFIGRQLELPNGQSNQSLIHVLENKKQQQKQCIFPLSEYYFKTDSTLCSQQQKCLLLCKSPKCSLLQLFQEKRRNDSVFSLYEVHSIVDRISQALREQQQHSQFFNPIDMSCIFFQNKSPFLIDFIMLNKDRQDYEFKGIFPSPELISPELQQQEPFDSLSSQLFSLGIIVLSLLFLKNNILSIYQKYSKHGNIKSINQQKLQKAINCISDEFLQQKISTLTQINSKSRKNIFILKQRQITNTFALNNHKIQHTLSQLIKKEKTTKNIKENLTPLQQRTNHQTNILNQPKKSINSNNSKNNISIKLIDPFQQQASARQVSIHPISNNEESQSQNNQKRQSQKNKQNQFQNNKENQKTNQNRLQLPSTPKKIQRQKHQFSTIKQVTEYDGESDIKKSDLKLIPEAQYQGSLLNGKKEGYGKCLFPEGSRYQGNWQNDLMNGFGKLYYPDGTLAYQGTWLNNQFHGKGKVYCLQPVKQSTPINYADFTNHDDQMLSYEGQLVRDKRHGWGILTFSNGQKYDGQFMNDLIEGEGTFYCQNNKKIKGTWIKGKLMHLFPN